MRSLFLALFALYSWSVALDAAIQLETIQQALDHPPEIGSLKGSPRHFQNMICETMQNNILLQFVYLPDVDMQGVVLTFEGGEVEETAANHGITQAAFETWVQTALNEKSISQSLQDRKISFSLDVRWDCVHIHFFAPNDQLNYVLALIHTLIKNPEIQPDALQIWKADQRAFHSETKHCIDRFLKEQLDEFSLNAEERRVRFLELNEIESLEYQEVVNWLQRHIKTAPLAVTCWSGTKGNFNAFRHIFLRYLGSLLSRQAIGTSVDPILRELDRQDGPFEGSFEIDCQESFALINCGYICTMSESIEARLAVEALQYYVKCPLVIHHMPNHAFKNYGLILMYAIVEPDQAEKMLAYLDQEFAKLIQQDICPGDWEIIRYLAKRRENDSIQTLLDRAASHVMRKKDASEWIVSAESIDASSPAKVKEWLQAVAKKHNQVRLIAKPKIQVQP